MLLVSIALHVGLAIGLFLPHFHYNPPAVAASTEPVNTSLILLSSFKAPDVPSVTSVKPAASSIPATLPQAVPVLSDSPVKKEVPTPAPNAITLEANPNAHVRMPQIDTLLSPTPAPHLNSRDGTVFVLDISGSMYEPYAGSTRLVFARQVLSQRLRALKDGTPFSIVVYAEKAISSGPLVAATNATRDAAVRFIMQDFNCGGGTNLPLGLSLAEKLSPGNLLVVTDGDLNISQHDLLAQTQDILGAKGNSPSLTLVAICPRPGTEAVPTLRGLADQQSGTYLAEQSSDLPALLTSNKTESAAR